MTNTLASVREGDSSVSQKLDGLVNKLRLELRWNGFDEIDCVGVMAMRLRETCSAFRFESTTSRCTIASELMLVVAKFNVEIKLSIDLDSGGQNGINLQQEWK